MNINSPLLRKFVTLGRVNAESVRANQHNCQSVAELITRCSEIDSKQLVNMCIELFRVPYFDLQSFDIKQINQAYVKETLIRRHGILPLIHKGNKLYIAVSDPTDYDAFENFEFSTGMHCEIVVVDHTVLEQKIEQLFDASNELNFSQDELIEFSGIDVLQGNEQNEDSVEISKDDAPIIVYINKILMDAIRRNASDLHFEPYDHDYRIRFRIDGVLHEMASPPSGLSSRLAARIKIMAQLDISEKRVPQDGRIKLQLSHKKNIDFRVSTMPTLWGEKIVMRILDSNSAMLSIDALGMEEEQKRLYQEAINQPQGMILVTGPTGSGKTMSLYCGLGILNRPEINISTAEDPIEIYMRGINQVQINTKTNMTFANALRAFLRQDPDVVMVGEIRDLETAEIAIKASQTGHLVLSTLHTNSAPDTLTRLLNMGVPAYNVAASVSLVVAQRLTRLLCNHCKKPEQLPDKELLRQGFHKEDLKNLKLFQPVGCEKCTDGYSGRIGIYEVMEVTPEIAHLIMEGGNSLDIARLAKQQGCITLREAGLKKVAKGLTTLAEVNRVTRF